MNQPTVSIIITCFNHQNFIKQSFDSVLTQDYTSLEIIIIDDCSIDNSKKEIENIKRLHPSVKTIYNSHSLGYCKTFNKAFKLSTGDFIIDLAADDILLKGKIKTQIKLFEKLPKDFGIVYSNLKFINVSNQNIPDHRKKIFYPEGNIHSDLIERHLIYACTMMVKRAVFNELKGYNESYCFEDLDFFLRSSRNWKYAPIQEVLFAKRELTSSLSAKKKRKNNQLTIDTLSILKNEKIFIKTHTEKTALRKRFLYEAKEAFDFGNYTMAFRFLMQLIIL